MKYTIEVSGRGAECYVHKISQEQFNELKKYDTTSDSTDIVIEELGVDDYFETDLIRSGLYDIKDNFFVTVKNEANEIIWESNKSLDLELNDYEEAFWIGNHVVFEDEGKGVYSEGEFEIDGEFDPLKLTKIVSDVCEIIQIIIGFNYDGVKIDTIVGDTRSICLAVNVV
jgi:hypothetical protein